MEVLNSTAIQVFWRSPVQNRQHGQIRGYQVHYVRMENGEAKGLPQIKDVMLADAQVRACFPFAFSGRLEGSGILATGAGCSPQGRKALITNGAASPGPSIIRCCPAVS